MSATATPSGSKQFHLRVITPDRVVLDENVTELRVPIYDGYMGVLHNHAPLIAPLGTGVLTAVVVGSGSGTLPQTLPFTLGGPMDLFVSNGFIQVDHNEVRVVCDAGERADEINLERARESEKRARERLDAQRKSGMDRPRAEAALRRALLRERLAAKSHHKPSEHGLR